MAISDQWASYREDDVGKAQKMKDLILSDHWWDVVDYIIEFTTPIYDMLREAEIDRPCLHLVYESWDSMIEKVKAVIDRNEGLEADENSSFFNVVRDKFYHKGSALVRVPEQHEGNDTIPIAVTVVRHEDKCQSTGIM
ncbi:hypothetical protein SO802_002293 [Lithocarpus litseifolius]|uniref:Uncharacterized protein n=1 Tax=Lithocarpus litseifolius TaxID=425828 RepID=A0AAW2DYM6_9ROSI